MKKLALAIIATYVILMATNYVVHSIWLMPDYDAIPLSHRNIWGIQHRFWAMLLGQFFFSAMFAYIYTRGRENKSWIEQGAHHRPGGGGNLQRRRVILKYRDTKPSSCSPPGRLFREFPPA
jgi:hypothetical protein